MTDTELARRMAICEVAGVGDIGEISDGFHTFNSLYEQRMILFAALVKAYKDKSWKSYRHEDGEYCFGGGWFVVGIDTPEGGYTYHYENKYWDMFDCVDLPRAKHWDGHTEADAETRLMSLSTDPQWIPCSERLPECEREVLICTKKKIVGKNAYIDSIITPAIYEDGTMLENDSKWHWVDMDYAGWDEEEDCGIIPEGWWENRHFYPDGDYNNVVDREVVAWMPLPEPYKEGEQE